EHETSGKINTQDWDIHSKLPRNLFVVQFLEVKDIAHFKSQPGWTQWLIIPALWEAQADGRLELRSWRPAWATCRNSGSTKYTKINWMWWHAPVFPATQEVQVTEWIEPGRWRLQ
uniref:Uncharacterized protein n=1 Tax=Piliocolobus tephrosceles TaxID=591936 RepID=A0A8C9LL13_9PRIM